MLTVRRKQIAVLAAVMKDRFERRMLAHLRATFSDLTAGRLDDNILAFVRFGMKRSAVHDVAIERDVERYLEYMVLYGPRFDTDARYAWAAKILEGDASGTAKMDRIDEYDQFMLGRPECAPLRRQSHPARPNEPVPIF